MRGSPSLRGRTIQNLESGLQRLSAGAVATAGIAH